MKVRYIVAAALAVALQSATVFAQDSGGMQGMNQQKHREMMPVHAKIIEQQKAQDTEIEKLLAQMNSATGEKRIDAIVAVINKLLEQRKAMNAEMAAHIDR
ncbi:MAG TPA: hypothetical protein VFA51_12600 [Candidatus Udaeobacter sp.]|nr:hypothetical protein [Candidatus Udaeobacter sp.]